MRTFETSRCSSLALFLLGFLVLLVFPAKYTATSLVFIDPREQKITNEQDVLPGIGQDAAALQSVIEIAKSDGFLRPLIERLNVANDAEIAGGETNIAQLLTRFRNRLDVTRRGLTYVVAFSFSSSDANRAAYYANAVAEAFVAEQAKTRSAATQQAAEWLNNRLAALRDQLTKSEDAVAAFRSQYKLIDAGKDSTLRQVRATELTQQASLAKLRAEEAKVRYDQITRDLKSNIDTSTGSRSELLTTLRAQRTQFNDQIAQKRAVLGDRHPDVIISLTQRDELERQIETERRRILQAAKSDYETLRDQQKHFEDLLNSTEREMLSTGQAAVKLQDLQRQVDANRGIYEQFLSRYKTTNEQRSLQTEQTRVVSSATVPARPSRPALPILLAAMAMAALIVSASAVIFYETSGRKLFAHAPKTSAAPEAKAEPAAPRCASVVPPAPPQRPARISRRARTTVAARSSGLGCRADQGCEFAQPVRAADRRLAHRTAGGHRVDAAGSGAASCCFSPALCSKAGPCYRRSHELACGGTRHVKLPRSDRAATASGYCEFSEFLRADECQHGQGDRAVLAAVVERPARWV